MKYVVILFVVFIVSCTGNSVPDSPVDSVEFILTWKDSTAVDKYNYYKKDMSFYYENERDSFSISYDSLKEQWLFKRRNDSSVLFFEKRDVYYVSHNGRHPHTVSKLIKDKGETDGEVTYVIDHSEGLLCSKSNTWRIARYLKTDDPYISALIFKIITDEKFYRNAVDFGGPLLTPPSY